jgi:hypothetical protein
VSSTSVFSQRGSRITGKSQFTSTFDQVGIIYFAFKNSEEAKMAPTWNVGVVTYKALFFKRAFLICVI